MGMTVNQRGEIVDAIDQLIAIDIPDPAPLPACGIDRIRLHEHRRSGVAAWQARQRTIVERFRF
ncbi:hypothetical protein [Bradyrhizobium vignae]|uniref:hypothetical protein n=1 Tax=Bradyrhizobium vignae TaxID=1549949 RepID=UPI001FCE743A|nr:hypothetical protein [Bradyrhizobium vignae]